VKCCRPVIVIVILLVELAVSKTVAIEKRFVEIEDHGIKLRLTIVDTPGFGDAVDASQWYDDIIHPSDIYLYVAVFLFSHIFF